MSVCETSVGEDFRIRRKPEIDAYTSSIASRGTIATSGKTPDTRNIRGTLSTPGRTSQDDSPGSPASSRDPTPCTSHSARISFRSRPESGVFIPRFLLRTLFRAGGGAEIIA